MLAFLIQLLIVVLIVGCFAYALEPLFSRTGGKMRLRGFVGAAVLAVLLVFSLGIRQIDAGHIGVVRQWGAVTNLVLNPGLSWTVPVMTSVDDVNVQTRSIRIADDPNTLDRNEGYSAASKEQQDLFMNMTLNYHVDPAQAASIIQNIGSDFEAKIVMPRYLDIPKSVTDDYPTNIVLNSRDEIRDKAMILLRDALAPYGFVVENIAIENFSYSPEYNASIEAKQIAQQQVETEKQKLAQQEIIAQQKVAAATGDADAQIERARGEAESNRLISSSLTDEILINRYIEKLAPGVTSILVPSENGFILDLGDALKPTPPPAQ
jgi:regulator of protease activity HflC (stomatin/prohibitin superfamily)